MDFNYRMIDDGTFCITSYKGKEEQIILPDNLNVTVLFDDLFKGHTEILSVKIPDSITDIGGFVFDGCINLKELRLPSNLNNLWQYSLARCGIESIVIPGTVKSLVPYTFLQCKNLKTVKINEGTTRICAWAFKDCTSLMDVYLPKNLTDINEQAFLGCSNINFNKYD